MATSSIFTDSYGLYRHGYRSMWDELNMQMRSEPVRSIGQALQNQSAQGGITAGLPPEREEPSKLLLLLEI